jgi:DeoR/GlpR family transcriptional regulator of sugar metabolism
MGRPATRSDVFASERRVRIARVIEEDGRARAVDLAVRFGVSAFTIRKDLHALEASGQVTRAYGGAIARDGGRGEGAFELRQRLRRAAKDAIGRAAAAMVVDGESIAMDASTTALSVASHLKARGGWVHLTVITNGLRIASELASSPGITVAMPGGFVRWEALSLVGQLGDAVFRRVNVQKAFLGAAGFTLDSGLSDATEEEAQIKGFMASSAREVIGIVDSSKWSRTAFATFCRTDALTAMVTDSDAPVAMVDQLRSGGVEVLLVPADGRPIPAINTRTGALRAARPQER